MTVEAIPEKEFKGKVSIVYPSLEEKTRTLMVEAQSSQSVGNSETRDFFAQVKLYTGAERGVVLVPITALLYEGDKIRVFIAEADKAKERAVKIGRQYKFQPSVPSIRDAKEYTEIIEGVKEGELVVTVGQQNLFEGAKINVAR